MKSFPFTLVICLSIGAVFGRPALAEDRDGPEIDSGVLAALNLTDAQKSRLEDTQYKSKAARIAIKAREETAELELRHDLGATTLDEKAIAKDVDAFNAAKADLEKNKVDQMIAFRKILTPDQWTKARSMWHEGKEREEAHEGHEGHDEGHEGHEGHDRDGD